MYWISHLVTSLTSHQKHFRISLNADWKLGSWEHFCSAEESIWYIISTQQLFLKNAVLWACTPLDSNRTGFLIVEWPRSSYLMLQSHVLFCFYPYKQWYNLPVSQSCLEEEIKTFIYNQISPTFINLWWLKMESYY